MLELMAANNVRTCLHTADRDRYISTAGVVNVMRSATPGTPYQTQGGVVYDSRICSQSPGPILAARSLALAHRVLEANDRRSRYIPARDLSACLTIEPHCARLKIPTRQRRSELEMPSGRWDHAAVAAVGGGENS